MKKINKIDNPKGFYGVDNRWHAIKWVGNNPYRERVEMILFKKIQNTIMVFCENRDIQKNGKYIRFPGGSVERNLPDKIQAHNELNEEARLKAKNIVGLNYIRSGLYDHSKYKYNNTHMGGFNYFGSHTKIFIGLYDGPYENPVEKEDMDLDMLKYGDWYPYLNISKSLDKNLVHEINMNLCNIFR